MKWIVDAQLPKRLAIFLREIGEDAVHTLDLPNKNATSDNEIRERSLQEQRIVISQDADFLESLPLRGTPNKLLIIATGNINNDELMQLFEYNFQQISNLFVKHTVIELNRSALIVRQ
jgi:predicted nuclease of predicted toxin-antitoxin system